MKKLCNTEAGLKKCVAYKKRVILSKNRVKRPANAESSNIEHQIKYKQRKTLFRA